MPSLSRIQYDKLNEHSITAREHVQALKHQTEIDPGALSRKQAAARASSTDA